MNGIDHSKKKITRRLATSLTLSGINLVVNMFTKLKTKFGALRVNENTNAGS